MTLAVGVDDQLLHASPTAAKAINEEVTFLWAHLSKVRCSKPFWNQEGSMWKQQNWSPNLSKQSFRWNVIPVNFSNKKSFRWSSWANHDEIMPWFSGDVCLEPFKKIFQSRNVTFDPFLLRQHPEKKKTPRKAPRPLEWLPLPQPIAQGLCSSSWS